MRIFLLLFFFFSPYSNAATLHNYPILRVIDGDTISFHADFLPEPLKKELSLRIYGVDTPEKNFRAKCPREALIGDRASEFTIRKIRSATDVKIELRSWDKYGGRVLGDVYLDGKSLRNMLITEGFAKEYYGEQKSSWCD